MVTKPIVFDLFCGLGGWSEAFIAEGYQAIGFDIEKHDYGFGCYPGELVLRDIRSITGDELVRQYGAPVCIVASPPCQEFSYMAMPWSKAKEKMRKIVADPKEQIRLTELFNQCFRIQREVSEAAGRYVPMVVENVKGAQKWVGRSRWNFGSFHLWGDVPALMPIERKFKSQGLNWSDQTKRGQDFTRVAGRQAMEGIKLPGNNSDRRWSNMDIKRLGDAGLKKRDEDGYDYPNRSFGWKAPATSSRSNRRKQASAEIAKIPPMLAWWMAKCFKPELQKT